MNESVHFDVIIIGAGPSGLTLAYHLQKMGIKYIILEKQNQVGASWRSMPEHLKLITYWQSNVLTEEDVELFEYNKNHKAKEYADYLDLFASKNKLDIHFNQEVLSAEFVQEIYQVKCLTRTYQSKVVVHCEGYFSFPKKPHFHLGERSPKIIHFNQFQNAQSLSSYKNICVVGKRLSAGQVIEELVKQNSDQKIYLSKRSPLKFGAPPVVFKFFLKYLPFLELLMKIFVSNNKNIEVPMPFELKEIIKNQVEVIEDIVEAEGQKIKTTDGRMIEVDLIILTTGYEEKKIKLKNQFESSTDKNRYFLGLNNQRTFTSRFLRGIKDDTPILAQLISVNLFSKNKFQ